MTKASTDGAASSSAARGGSRRKSWRRIGLRLGLAFGAFALTVAVLEFAARMALEDHPPLHHVRDGVYFHGMPLVNGLSWTSERTSPPNAELLSLRPSDRELRVFVFGESSVQGCPWTVEASPPAMLYDLLEPRFPDREVTVVNLGLGGAMMLDAYYYLLSVRPYGPDVVVFYQGTNDNFFRGTENCMPATHPWLHAAWRGLVERSRLLLAVRTLGPARLRDAAGDGGAGDSTSPPSLCPPTTAYAGWTDILVGAAGETGAEVVVVTPVQSVFAYSGTLNAGDPRSQGLPAFVDSLHGTPRELARCVLDARCSLPDSASAAVEVGRAEPGSSDSTERQLAEALIELDVLETAWTASAEEHGATLVDFWSYVRDRVPAGIPMAPLVVDTVHLSLEGYALLALLMADATEAAVRGIPAPAIEGVDHPLPDVSAYVELLDRDSAPVTRRDVCSTYRAEGALWLSAGAVVIGTGLLQQAWEMCQDDTAGLALAWLHDRLDIPTALPSAVVERARYLDIDDHLRSAAGLPLSATD